ncbi:MAG: Re/Si-specific NAD(P)(+) transhydrogenase subunit alpha [Acidobacteriota bacterium]
MKVGVPKENRRGERRVALVPDAVRRLTPHGLEIVIERGAGAGSGVSDAEYESAGALLTSDPAEVWGADIVVKVDRPTDDEIALLRSGVILVAMLRHLWERDLVERLARAGVSAFAMDWMPRSTRAQMMDARSSMSTIQGYMAVILAAAALPRMMPMLMTAAGTVMPAHVLVIGAGVAGLSAIATARRLGASVEGFDVRPATRQEVESVGARFLAMDEKVEGGQDSQGYALAQSDEGLALERQTISRRLAQADVVITTALIPGREPPLLLTRDMMRTMRSGSVIVDLAAAFGGNCEATVAGEARVSDGVTVIGYTDLESRAAVHASQLYARNVANYLLYLVKDGSVRLSLDDELIRFPLVTHAGQVTAEMPSGGA